MTAKLWTRTLECSGDCGSQITLTGSDKREDATHSVAELLGWATVDKGKQTKVYCPHCIAQARRIVAQVGARDLRAET